MQASLSGFSCRVKLTRPLPPGAAPPPPKIRLKPRRLGHVRQSSSFPMDRIVETEDGGGAIAILGGGVGFFKTKGS